MQAYNSCVGAAELEAIVTEQIDGGGRRCHWRAMMERCAVGCEQETAEPKYVAQQTGAFRDVARSGSAQAPQPCRAKPIICRPNSISDHFPPPSLLYLSSMRESEKYMKSH